MELEGSRELSPTEGIEILTFSKFEIKEEPQDIDEDGWYISTYSDSDGCVEGPSPVDGLQRLQVQVKFERDTCTDDEGYVTPAKKRVLTEEERIKRRQASREWRAKRRKSDPDWHTKEAARISTLYVPKRECSEEKWNDYKNSKREAMTMHRARKHQPSSCRRDDRSSVMTPEPVELPISEAQIQRIQNSAAWKEHLPTTDADDLGIIDETPPSEQDISNGAAKGTASDTKFEILKIETVDEDGDDGRYDKECRVFDANERDPDREPISCHICREEFWNVVLLKEHINNHHTVKTMDVGSTCSSAELEKSNESVCSRNKNDELYCGIEGHHSVDIVTVTPFHGAESQSETAETCSFENEQVYDEVTACHRNRADVFDPDNRSSDSFREFVNIQATLKVISKQNSGRIPAGQATSAENGDYLLGTPPVKPFSCALCPKSFPHKRLLQSHYKTHKRQAERKCPFCQRTFTRVSKMNHHIETHNGQNFPDEAIRCHTCQKTFSSASNLNRHLLIHNGEKSFRCEMCDRSFSDKSSLRNHQYTHTKEKAFRCEICRTRFKQKRCLVRHIFKQHQDQESNSWQEQS